MTPASVSKDIVRTFSTLPNVTAPNGRAVRSTSRLHRLRCEVEPASNTPDVARVRVTPASTMLERDGDERPSGSRDSDIVEYAKLYGPQEASEVDTGLQKHASASGPTGDHAVRVGLKPRFVAQLESRIDRELRLLTSGGQVASADDRLAVFQDAAQQIVPCFAHFGGILQRIFNEYNSYVGVSRAHAAKLADVEATLGEVRRETASETASLRAVVQQWEERDRQRLADLEIRKGSYPSIGAAIERMDVVESKLRAEKVAKEDAERRLAHTTALTSDFNRTLRAMEDNFTSVVNDKDFEISRLTCEVGDARRQLGDEREAHRSAAMEMRETIDGLHIAASVREQREAMLKERIRHLESHVASLAARFTDLQSDVAVLEARLERVNKSTIVSRARDPVMTPRPNKSDVTSKVTALGSAQHFNSTQAMIDALCESHRTATDRAEASEKFVARIESLIASDLSAAKTRMRAELTGVETAAVAAQTDPL